MQGFRFLSRPARRRGEKSDFVFAVALHADMPTVARFLIDGKILFATEKSVGISADDVAGHAAGARAHDHLVAVPKIGARAADEIDIGIAPFPIAMPLTLPSSSHSHR